jgi:threonine aldolase
MELAEWLLAGINDPEFYHSPLTSLVCVENTTNKGGGACYELEDLQRIKQVCDANNLKFHLDVPEFGMP